MKEITAEQSGKLKELPQELAEKLKVMIDNGIPYIVITGSDPDIEGGCCPCMEVSHANQLVKAGILDSWAPKLDENSCTMTVYAFSGEIISRENESPAFEINKEMRNNVLKILTGC